MLITGDWHCGSGLDYGREPGDRLADQETVYQQIVDLAVEHDVDAVLLAGDLWHRRRPTPAEMMAVARPLRRLHAELDCDILGIAGNHCVETAALPIALDLLEDIVDLHREPGVWHGQNGVTVATLPWTPVARLIATRDGGDRDDNHSLAAQLLIETARDLRAQVDGPAILLLHWSISGASTPTGVYTDDFREVVIPCADLERLGYDAVVAAHIHRQQILCHDPLVAYVGSPAPVDFSEADTDHGCLLLDINEAAVEHTRLEVATA